MRSAILKQRELRARQAEREQQQMAAMAAAAERKQQILNNASMCDEHEYEHEQHELGKENEPDNVAAPTASVPVSVSPIPVPPTLQLPRWTGEMTKKRALAEARNAKAREETRQKRERRRMREMQQQGGIGSAAIYGNGSGSGKSSGSEDDNEDLAVSEVCMSAAKRQFKKARQEQQYAASSTAATRPSTPPRSGAGITRPMSSASAASASSSSIAAAASPATPIPPPSPSSLPAFTTKKPTIRNSLTALPAPLRGSGIKPRNTITHAHSHTSSFTAADRPDRYYHVNFTPRSMKKHKNYEDGVLTVSGRRCTLQEMSGRQVSTQLVSWSTESEKMVEGNNYLIGSWEIELGTSIDPGEYQSGRIFVGSCSTPTLTSKSVGNKDESGDSSSGGGGSHSQSSKQRSRVGAALFIKQPIINRTQFTMDAAAQVKMMLDDPSVLLLNRAGVVQNGEKAMIVEPFLAKCLRQHQREGVQFMYDCVMGVKSPGYEGVILADEMGLGKTLQAIALAYTLLKCSPRSPRQGVVKKVIIVCPATLVGNWEREFKKWLGSHRAKLVIIPASLPVAEQRQLVQDFMHGTVNNVLIIGYELFRKHVTELKTISQPLLIMDEGHRLKSTSGNKTIRALSAINTRKKVLLTGTPVQNDLGEFFAMSDFVNPRMLGDLSTFRRTFEAPISRSRDINATTKEKRLGEARAQELAERTKCFVLRRSNEILLQYLPEKIEQVLFIPLTEMQANIYKALLRSKSIRQCLARGSGGPNDALALQCINYLKKLVNHPALVHSECLDLSSGEWNNGASVGGAAAGVKPAISFYPPNYVPAANFADTSQSSKLAVLEHLLTAIKAEGQRVVVVSNYKETLDMIAAFLHTKQWLYLRLDGSTPAAERPSLVDRFNASYATEYFIFLLSARAGGVGLNLTGGSRLILYDPDWNPAVDAQALSRVWRDGQPSTVYIYRFLTTATIDEKIYQRQQRKNELARALDRNGQEGIGNERSFDQKTLREIFTYKQDTDCETRDIMNAAHKTQEQREELALMMGDFHQDLSYALDPILHSLPSHLVSTFLNHVSSQEENERMLKLMAAKAEKQMRAEEERGEKKSKKDVDGTDVAHCDEFDSDFEHDEPNTKSSNDRLHRQATDGTDEDDDDDDEGEAEYIPSSTSTCKLTKFASMPPSSSTSSPSSSSMSGLDADVSMSPDGAEQRQDPEHEHVDVAMGGFEAADLKDPRGPGPHDERDRMSKKRKSRHIIEHDEDGDDGDGHDYNDHEGSMQQDGDGDEWVLLPRSSTTSAPSSSSSSSSTPIFGHPLLNSAAASIAPPPPSPHARVEFSLDSIAESGPGQLQQAPLYTFVTHGSDEEGMG